MSTKPPLGIDEVKTVKDWYSFRKLLFYFDHQLEEEEITIDTYRAMMDAVEQFRPPLEEYPK